MRCLGGEAAVGRVWPHLVVVLPPSLDDAACLVEAREHLLVQAFVPEPAVEALHEGVLGRLPRGDVVPFHAPAVGPLQHCPRGQFRPVVGDRSEEHTSELQSLMRISYAVFCLKKKKTKATKRINSAKQITIEKTTITNCHRTERRRPS